jgi:hypothetical protein
MSSNESLFCLTFQSNLIRGLFLFEMSMIDRLLRACVTCRCKSAISMNRRRPSSG